MKFICYNYTYSSLLTLLELPLMFTCCICDQKLSTLFCRVKEAFGLSFLALIRTLPYPLLFSPFSPPSLSFFPPPTEKIMPQLWRRSCGHCSQWASDFGLEGRGAALESMEPTPDLYMPGDRQQEGRHSACSILLRTYQKCN